MAYNSGCSPYDLCRLESEYPEVFEEYMSLYTKQRLPFSQRRAAGRKERVNRIFGHARRGSKYR